MDTCTYTQILTVCSDSVSSADHVRRSIRGTFLVSLATAISDLAQKWTGNMFTHSHNDHMMRMKSIPYLGSSFSISHFHSISLAKGISVMLTLLLLLLLQSRDLRTRPCCRLSLM